MGATGDKVKARYTYNYVKEDGIWKIQHHHSSVMPEEIALGKPITESEVRGLFSLWNNALATLDPKTVASRYAKKGVLLPTVSDTPRTDFASIEDYFKKFLQLKPQGEILESECSKTSMRCIHERDDMRSMVPCFYLEIIIGHVTIGKNWCSDVGIYEVSCCWRVKWYGFIVLSHSSVSVIFNLQFTMGATGKKVKGRYTFVYVYEDGEWKINHHHSSILPEGIVTAEPITEEEVRGLFNLWNDALATLDPKKVANRYAKEGVLLPTVSDVPRTDYNGIEDYFTKFLQLKPQGKVSTLSLC
jgi:hypothetical protein